MSREGKRLRRRPWSAGGLLLLALVIAAVPVSGGSLPHPAVSPHAERGPTPALSGPWSNLTSTAGPGPPSPLGSILVNDSADGYDLWFGGSSGATGATWTFGNGTWTNRTSSLATAPPPRTFAAAAYDSVHQYVVLFGGLGDPSYLNDTWIWKAGSWTNLTPYVGISPPPRAEAAATYDRGGSQVLLFGGIAPAGPLGDTWAFSGGRWAHLLPLNAPPAACCASLAFDTHDGYPLLVLRNGTEPLVESWSFSSGTWSNQTAAVGPGARQWGVLVDDPAVAGVVLFGGSSLSRPPYWPLGDSWIYSAGAWTRAGAGSGGLGSPAPRWGASAAPLVPGDPDSCFLVVGGAPTNGTSEFAGDTWSGCGNRTVWTQGGGGNNSGGGTPPTVLLTADRYSGIVPFRTNLTVSVSNGTGPYELSLCDSVERCTSYPGWSGAFPIHRSVNYTAPGTVSLVALVTDSLGLTGSATASIRLTEPAPLSAVPTLTRTSGIVPVIVGFSSTVSGGIAPYTVQWNFDDGTYGAGVPGKTLNHPYDRVGVYHPTLVVTDALGATVNLSLPSVEVRPVPATVGNSTTSSGWGDLVLPAAIVLLGGAVAAWVYAARRRRVVSEADETLREVEEPVPVGRNEGGP